MWTSTLHPYSSHYNFIIYEAYTKMRKLVLLLICFIISYWGPRKISLLRSKMLSFVAFWFAQYKQCRHYRLETFVFDFQCFFSSWVEADMWSGSLFFDFLSINQQKKKRKFHDLIYECEKARTSLQDIPLTSISLLIILKHLPGENYTITFPIAVNILAGWTRSLQVHR